MKHITTLLITFHLIGVSYGQSYQKIIEEEPGTKHYFGSSGDIHGDYAVVTGIHSPNPNAWSGGIANIYKRSAEGNWEFTRTMYPISSSNQDRFGQDASAIWGNKVIVGDWMNVKQKCGSAHIFRFNLEDDTSWLHTAMLKPNDHATAESFGQTVDIFKNTAVVGATDGAYIFNLSEEGNWKQSQKIKAPQGSGGFGQNVVIHGDFIVVSSQWEDIGAMKNQGAIYIYKREMNDRWSFFQKIAIQDGEEQEKLEFGYSIALNKDFILVGAPQKNIGELDDVGAAYLYRLEDKYIFEQKLFASDFSRNKYRFGEKVSISDNFIVISEAQDQQYKGSVYIYENKEGTYTELDRMISPISSNYGNDFGQNELAVDGNNLFVGASGDGHCGEELSSCGSAFFFKLEKSKTPTEPTPYIPYGITDKIMLQKMKSFEADSIVFDPINEDDVYKLRNKETQLWGLFQLGNELVPMEYEDINFNGWNHPFTFVKKNGKWGIFYRAFSNKRKLSSYCKYEKLEILEHQQYLYVAGKRDGKWSWVNWASGEEHHVTKDYRQELVIYKNWNPGDYSDFKLK